ncbi:hypothetical protein J6TS2_10960 [Heyndrickxia sporothermodurans]|nr:hypothetical protein J6TS2_10960 [Heyndrickxia sporothermodurans]
MKQTAEIINKYLHLPLEVMEEFIERSFGDAEGMTVEERMSAYPDKEYPNQEDRLSLEKRVMDGLLKINHKYKTGKVLLVAHGAVIHSILSSISDEDINIGKTPLLNACISNIQFHDEKWKIRDFNQVAHLMKEKR